MERMPLPSLSAVARLLGSGRRSSTSTQYGALSKPLTETTTFPEVHRCEASAGDERGPHRVSTRMGGYRTAIDQPLRDDSEEADSDE
jgi:hypothetical protein